MQECEARKVIKRILTNVKCNKCGKIKKEDVWENAGILEINVHNKITENQKEK